MRPSRATFRLCLAGIVNLVLAPAAWANFAPRFWGDAAGEPWGLKNVAITQERLTVDLRPLADKDPVRVEVTYDLHNAGAPKHLDLLFISGQAGLSDFEAHLGKQPLPAQPLPAAEARRLWEQAPRSWRPPQEAPGLVLEKTYYLLSTWATTPELVAFPLDLPPGPSTLNVRYRARASGSADQRPTVTWQLPYVLAPAREWGTFGRLEVVVHVPGGWEARSTPALAREGDTLRGSFNELPGDALLFATGAPVPPGYYWAVGFAVALWVAVIVGGPPMCWWAGRRLGRAGGCARGSGGEATGQAALRGFVLGVFPALLWGALIYASAPASLGMIKWSLHGQESPSFADPWSAGPCVNCFIPAAFLLGVGIAFGSAGRAARRNSAKPAITP